MSSNTKPMLVSGSLLMAVVLALPFGGSVGVETDLFGPDGAAGPLTTEDTPETDVHASASTGLFGTWNWRIKIEAFSDELENCPECLGLNQSAGEIFATVVTSDLQLLQDCQEAPIEWPSDERQAFVDRVLASSAIVNWSIQDAPCSMETDGAQVKMIGFEVELDPESPAAVPETQTNQAGEGVNVPDTATLVADYKCNSRDTKKWKSGGWKHDSVMEGSIHTTTLQANLFFLAKEEDEPGKCNADGIEEDELLDEGMRGDILGAFLVCGPLLMKPIVLPSATWGGITAKTHVGWDASTHLRITGLNRVITGDCAAPGSVAEIPIVFHGEGSFFFTV